MEAGGEQGKGKGEGEREREKERREGFNSFRARWKRFRLKTVWSGDFSTWAKFRESAST